MSSFTTAHYTFTASNQLPWSKNELFKLEDAAFLLCHRGSAWLTINLERFKMEAHTQSIILPRSMVELSEMSDDFSISYVTLSNTLFREITMRFDPSFFAFIRKNPCVNLTRTQTKPIRSLLYILLNLYKERENIYQQEIARNLLQAFLLDVYDKTQRCCVETIHPEGMSRQTELFKSFILLIQQHCRTQREVSFYAKELFITPRYLSGLVHQVTGKKAKAIIDHHALLEIKLLLRSTNLSLQEIAHQLAFPDQSFFGRYFKRHTGLSPHQYRKEK